MVWFEMIDFRDQLSFGFGETIYTDTVRGSISIK